jgi:hypothetical protein
MGAKIQKSRVDFQVATGEQEPLFPLFLFPVCSCQGGSVRGGSVRVFRTGKWWFGWLDPGEFVQEGTVMEFSFVGGIVQEGSVTEFSILGGLVQDFLYFQH